jgi:hypothetical protein
MFSEGAGGFGAVSVGIAEVVVVVLLIALVFGLWKLARLVWIAFSG